MIKCKVVAMVVKLMPLSFRNGIIECSKPNLTNKEQNCITMDCSIFMFTSNNPIIICMGTQVSFKILITKAKVFTLP
jgi:hypothetical protein